MLTITDVENFDEMTVLRCLGRIVRGYETVLLCPAVQQEGRNVVLDLTQVDAIDAAGIGALVSLQAAGVYLKLMNPNRQVREILTLTNLDTVFEICESHSTYPTTGSTQAGRPNNQSDTFQLAPGLS
jgi:anti-anti-sigma factor